MHIPARRSTRINTPEGTIWKYLMNEGVGISYQTLSTSTPASGSHLNTKVHEIYVIIRGTAKFSVGDETYEVGERDIVVVEPNTAHSIETAELVFLTITRPDWYIEQYQHIGDHRDESPDPDDSVATRGSGRGMQCAC